MYDRVKQDLGRDDRSKHLKKKRGGTEQKREDDKIDNRVKIEKYII